MEAKVVRLVSSAPNTLARLRTSLQRASSILKRIESEELLAAFPDCPLARGNHLFALRLLAQLEVEIVSLWQALDDGRP